MENEDKKLEENEIAREAKDLEIDESLLTEEEKANNKVKFPKGMLIFILVLLVLIVGLSIVVALLWRYVFNHQIAVAVNMIIWYIDKNIYIIFF